MDVGGQPGSSSASWASQPGMQPDPMRSLSCGEVVLNAANDKKEQQQCGSRVLACDSRVSVFGCDESRQASSAGDGDRAVKIVVIW